METRTWIIVAVTVAITFLFGGACMCAVLGYVFSTASDAELDDARAEREGTTFGQHASSEECISNAHDRSVACGTIAPDCNAGAERFLRGCLHGVATPDPALCNGVPAPTTLGDWEFADSVCHARGWSSDSGECDPVAAAISVYCHGG